MVAQVIGILMVTAVVCLFGMLKTIRLWHGIIVASMFFACLGLIAGLEKAGWD